MRRLLVSLLSLATVAVAAPSQAAAPRLQRQLMVFTYDGLGPALLSVEGSVEAIGRPGYFATVIADEFDGQLDPFFPDVIDLGGNGSPARTYGAVGAHDLCVSPVVTCTPSSTTGSLGFGVSFSVGRSTRPQHLRLLLALEGTKVSASHVELGWKAHVRHSGFTRSTAGGTGVRAFGAAVEAMPDASLRGGRSGSIAVAVPPCEDVGAGVVRLTGGRTTETAICPSYPVAAAAAGPTTWTTSGPAAGITTYRTRLIVIDL